jgi:hypothetical protein
MYTTGYWVNNSTFPVHMAEAFEDVLVKFDVDIALWGHVHAYERSKCGIYRGKCSPTKAPYHATIGTLMTVTNSATSDTSNCLPGL